MSTLERSKSLRRTKSCAADYRKPKDIAGSFTPALPSSSAARSAAASAFLASANLPPLPPLKDTLPESSSSRRRTQSVRFVGNARAGQLSSEEKSQGTATRKRSQSVSLTHQPQDQILSTTLRSQDPLNDTLRNRLSRAKSIFAADRPPGRVDTSVSSNSPAAVALAREQYYATEQPVTQNLNRTTSVRTSRSIRSLRRSVRSSHVDANAGSNHRSSRPPKSSTRFKRFFKKIFGFVEEVDLCSNPESDLDSSDVISDQIVPPIEVDSYTQNEADTERGSHVRNFSRPSRVSSWTDNSTTMPSRHSFHAGASISSVNEPDPVSNWVRETSGPRGGSLYQEPLHSYVTHAGHELDVRRVYTALRGHVDGIKDVLPTPPAQQRDSSLKTITSELTVAPSPPKPAGHTLDTPDLEEEPLTPTPRQRRAREIKPAFFPKPARVRPSSLSPHRDNHYEREAFANIMSPSVYSEHDEPSLANHWKDDSPGLATVIMSSKVPRAGTTALQPHPSIESLHWSSFLASNISRLEQQRSENLLREFSMVTRDLENNKAGRAHQSPDKHEPLDHVEPLSLGRARQFSISPLADVTNVSNTTSMKTTTLQDGKKAGQLLHGSTHLRDASRSTVRRSINDSDYAILSSKASFASRSSMQRQARHSPERIARLKRSYGHGLNAVAAASARNDGSTSPPRILMQQYLNPRNIELSETPRGSAQFHVDENMDETQRAFFIFPSTYRNPVVDDTVTKTKVQAQVTQQRVGREETDSSLKVNLPGSFRPRRNEEFRDYEVDDRTTRRADINIEVERTPRGRDADIDITERQYRRKFQPNYESDIDFDPPTKNIHIHSETLKKPESDESRMGYYDDAGNYHSFRRGLERAAEKVLHPLRSRRHDEVIVEREEVTVSSGRRGGPANVVSIPCHHVRVGDLLILQGHICQVIRISTSAQTGQHRYLGVDLFTKELHEELSTITTPGPNVVVQSMFGPVFKQYRVLDIRGDGRVVAMTESGEVKQSLPVIDQNELHERISDAFADGRGSIRVLVINDGGNELAVDYRVIHGSRL